MQQKQIEQVIEKYIRGINQSSTDALIPLFTKDGVVMAPDVRNGTPSSCPGFNARRWLPAPKGPVPAR